MKLTKTMVGKVLTTNRKITEKENDDYLLIGYSDLKKDERELWIIFDEFVKKERESVSLERFMY